MNLLLTTYLVPLSFILVTSQSIAKGITIADAMIAHEELSASKTNDTQTAEADTTSLATIINFQQLSPLFASAGMPTLEELTLLKQNGYRHIINLIPGDFDNEQQHVAALKMSFQQIAVDWHQPTLENFQTFAALMKKYHNEKVLVHCRLNYRASAFAYLYQTLLLRVDESTAKQEMHEIWRPDATWLEFIAQVQQHYQDK